MPEQVRANLALLEIAQEYAVDAMRQEPGQARLVWRIDSGSFRMFFAVGDQHIEGIKLHLHIMPARVQPVEIASAVDAEHR